MKKISILIWSVIAVALGCQPASEHSESTGNDERKTLVAYVSNYPLYYFTERIGGEYVDVRFPSSLSPDPAYWQPEADTINAMQSADLVILNGASYEQWLMNASLPAGKVVVTTSPFTDRLIESGETFTHSHGPEGEHEHTGTASTTWLDLSLAALQAEAIKDALSKQSPVHTTVFQSNYDSLAADLMELHKGFLNLNAASSGIHVAFSHPVYQYLQTAYGISGTSLHLEPDQSISGKMMHDPEHLAGDHEVTHLIWESTPTEGIDVLNEKLGVSNHVVDPCGNIPDSGDFISVFERNVQVLQEIFGE